MKNSFTWLGIIVLMVSFLALLCACSSPSGIEEKDIYELMFGMFIFIFGWLFRELFGLFQENKKIESKD